MGKFYSFFLLLFLHFSFFIFPFLWKEAGGEVYGQTVGIFGSTNLGVNSTGAKGHASSVFDISSTTGGLLIPRMTTAQRDALTIATPPETSLLIYNISTNQYEYYNGGWVAIAAGSGPWTKSGGNVYLTTTSDKVGIGITAPGTKLWVQDNSECNVVSYVATDVTGPMGFSTVRARGTLAAPLAMQAGDQLGAFTFAGHDGSSLGTPTAVITASATENFDPTKKGTQLNFSTTPNSSIVPQKRVTIDANGNVGIATTAPAARLDISSNSVQNGGFIKFTGLPSAGNILIQPVRDDGTQGWLLKAAGGGQDLFQITQADHTERFQINSVSGEMLLAPNGGFVGIGTTSPVAKLHVHDGATSALLISSNANLGSPNDIELIFKSDNDGTPNPATIGQYNDGALRFSGQSNLVNPDMIITDAGLTGIGIGSPLAKLHISGGSGNFNTNLFRLEGDYSSFGHYHQLDFSRTSDGAALTGIRSIFDDAGQWSLDFYGTTGGSPFSTLIMRMRGDGNVGIGTTSPAELLDVAGRIRIGALAAPGVTTDKLYNVAGDLFWNGVQLNSGSSGWSIIGNAGTVDGTNFIGTTDDKPFNIRVNNEKAGRIEKEDGVNFGGNTFYGWKAGNSNAVNVGLSEGLYNTATGNQSFYSNTSGNQNTASGYGALYNNTIGGYNTASGTYALSSNISGNENTAFGTRTLYFNTSGSYNTVLGNYALYSNKTGSNATAIGYNAMQYSNNTVTPFTNYNVAVGYEALRGSTTASANTGNYNTALGYQTMMDNTSGISNTAIGNSTLGINSTGGFNTAIGAESQLFNVEGNANTSVGYDALFYNKAGSNATAIGYNAMRFSNDQVGAFTNYNVALGFEALRGSATPASNTGNFNTALGYQTLWSNTSGNYNTASGNNALYSNTTGYNNSAYGMKAMYSNVTASFNSAFGSDALRNNTYAEENVAVGSDALYTQNYSNASTNWSSSNTAVGYKSLYSNQPVSSVSGYRNTAIGTYTLYTNSTGSYNASSGYMTLYSNSTGSFNTASGYQTLWSNNSGSNNAGFGRNALFSNKAGSNATAIGTNAMQYANDQAGAYTNSNVAVGYEALRGSTTAASNIGNSNAALGYQALRDNTSGGNNTASGYNAIFSNTTGNNNTGIGYFALYGNTIGAGNVGVGFQAGYTATPANANSTGSYNVFLGYNSGPASSTQRTNAIAIGKNAWVDADNAMVFGGTGADAVNVGIGTTLPLATLDITKDGGTVLFPRKSTGGDPAGAANGMIYYNANSNKFRIYENGAWVDVIASGTSGWSLLGNASTVDGTNFIGTTDDIPFNIRVNNQRSGYISNTNQRTFFGYQAGFNNSGTYNSSFGFQSLASGSSGSYNTASGFYALFSNTAGGSNSAFGNSAMYFNTIGTSNIALGSNALYSNVAGSNAVAIGEQAMYYANNQVGAYTNFNVAVGFQSLMGSAIPANNTGNNNTALGYQALMNNSSGDNNTAIGKMALQTNSSGYENIALGNSSLEFNTSGVYNIGIGTYALQSNTIGNENIATGHYALTNNIKGSANTANGFEALVSNSTAGQNTAIGHSALYSQSFSNGGSAWNSNNVAVGFEALFANQPVSTATGVFNTAIGNYTLRSNTTGASNTASGYRSLYSNTTGYSNTAIGVNALQANTSGYWNVASGENALYNNNMGYANIASGIGALFSNTTASRNTAIGTYALNAQSFNNGGATWESDNVAIGYEALFSNQPTGVANGNLNTALGNFAGRSNTTGSSNTFIGKDAGYSNSSGSNNIYIGNSSGRTNSTVSGNVYIGNSSGFNATSGPNTFVGFSSGYNSNTGSGNTFLGYNTGYNITSEQANTFVGHQAGYSATSFYNTFIGSTAGQNTNTGGFNTAVGTGAGLTNTTGNYNTFLGYGADASVSGLSRAMAIGYNARVDLSNSLVLGGTGADAVNVGIGTSSPSSKLHVNGDLRLGLASTTNASLIFNNNINGNFVTINSGATTATYALTLPTTQGGAGNVLTNNGSGALSWTSPGTVSSVTASAPIASSGGATPNISLSGTVPVGNGGTGRTNKLSTSQVIGTTDIAVPGAESDMADMTTTFTTYGTKMLVIFSAPFFASAIGGSATLRIYIDGVFKRKTFVQIYSYSDVVSFQHLETALSPGSHTVKIRWSGGSIGQNGSSSGERILTVLDLD